MILSFRLPVLILVDVLFLMQFGNLDIYMQFLYEKLYLIGEFYKIKVIIIIIFY